MNISTKAESSSGAREYLPQKRHDYYRHLTFRESDAPELAYETWKIHAEGYHAMGFIKNNAILEDGTLPLDIDKARGSNVQYYMTINPNDYLDCATLRKISIPPSSDYKELPAYKLCKDSLNEEAIELLGNIEEPISRIKEIAALSKTNHGSQKAVYELFRTAFQDGLSSKEIWFFSLVSSTYKSLSDSLGELCFKELGDKVVMNDERVSNGLTLNPILFDTSRFIDTLHNYYLYASSDTDKVKALRSFMFFSDGLEEGLMGNKSYETRQRIIEYFNGDK